MRPAVAVLAVLTVGWEAVTITPTQHDYGDVGIGGLKNQPFRVTLPTGAGPNDTLTATIEGADAADFNQVSGLVSDQCMRDGMNLAPPAWRSGACNISIDFRPRSLGPKSARVVMRDSRGGQATATLTGKGVAPVCEHKVVPCNYAFLYTGSFSWQSTLLGETGEYRRTVTVNVVHGVATCEGSETDVSISKQGAQTYRTTEVGTILGPGLIAVEFDTDESGALVYRVTGSCPSPVWQASRNLPSQPAELGSSYTEESYDQPATDVGINLVGNRSEPHPDTDQLNGVSGTIRVTWSLKRS